MMNAVSSNFVKVALKAIPQRKESNKKRELSAIRIRTFEHTDTFYDPFFISSS